MAHCAQIDNSRVTRVIRVSDMVANPEEWCRLRFGGVWKQTSYNARIRGKFAGIGDYYDEALDIFAPPAPYMSWTWSPEGYWQAPTPMPTDGQPYSWDEPTRSWVVLPSTAESA